MCGISEVIWLIEKRECFFGGYDVIRGGRSRALLRRKEEKTVVVRRGGGANGSGGGGRGGGRRVRGGGEEGQEEEEEEAEGQGQHGSTHSLTHSRVTGGVACCGLDWTGLD